MTRLPDRPGGGAARHALARPLSEVVVSLVAVVVAVGVAFTTQPHGSATTVPRAAASGPALTRPASTANRCERGEVALTFDDGPDLFTEPILEILRAYDAKATFFVLGAKVAARPAQVRTATADGHQLGNHSWDHPHLADLGPEQVQAQLLDTQRAVVAAGAPAPTVFRPPFGSTSPAVEQQAEALGLRVRTWTFDTEDWRGRAPADIVHAVLEQLSPGSVILLHDGTRDASSTVKALPDLIEGIRARGFCTAPMK